MDEAIAFLEEKERIKKKLKEYMPEKTGGDEVIHRVQILEEALKTIPETIVQAIDKKKKDGKEEGETVKEKRRPHREERKEENWDKMVEEYYGSYWRPPKYYHGPYDRGYEELARGHNRPILPYPPRFAPYPRNH